MTSLIQRLFINLEYFSLAYIPLIKLRILSASVEQRFLFLVWQVKEVRVLVSLPFPDYVIFCIQHTSVVPYLVLKFFRCHYRVLNLWSVAIEGVFSHPVFIWLLILETLLASYDIDVYYAVLICRCWTLSCFLLLVWWWICRLWNFQLILHLWLLNSFLRLPFILFYVLFIFCFEFCVLIEHTEHGLWSVIRVLSWRLPRVVIDQFKWRVIRSSIRF